ncbi:hypothetical protein ACH678_03615, partial [Klebsiella pneumoniae]
KSAQIREILISESAWEEMTCLFAPSLARCHPEPGQIHFIVINLSSKNVYHQPAPQGRLCRHGMADNASPRGLTTRNNLALPHSYCHCIILYQARLSSC